MELFILPQDSKLHPTALLGDGRSRGAVNEGGKLRLCETSAGMVKVF